MCEMAGSEAAPAARCRNRRRGSVMAAPLYSGDMIANLPPPVVAPLSKHSFESLRCRLLGLGYGKRRRDFLSVMGGAAAPWPVAPVRAQPKMPVPGFLAPGSLVVIGTSAKRRPN